MYKIFFLITVAVVSTTPWDSYLIRTRIWTYPPNAIIGPTLFRIPYEEVFFFVIQTYNTSLLYLLVSKPVFHPVFLCRREDDRNCARLRILRTLGQIFLAAAIIGGAYAVWSGGEGVYMGLILVWAGPFLLLLWYDQSRCHSYPFEKHP